MGQTNFDVVNATTVKRAGVAITDSQVTANAVANLQENSGAIGGTNDGNMPTLTATVVARTNPVGTANGAYETVGATNGSDVSGAIMNNFREVDTVLNQLIADNVAQTAAIREVADKLNDLMASLRTATLLNT